MADLTPRRETASDVEAATIPETCPRCEEDELGIELLDEDLVLRCGACGRRWRYGLGYLLPMAQSSD